MKTSLIRTIFLSLLFVVAPAGLVAQQQGAIDPAQLPPEAQELIAELQQLQVRLQPIQQEAMQDPEIQAAQQALGAEIQSVMVELDPETPERIERLRELMGEAQAAQAAQDQAAMAELVAEGRALEQELQAAQAEAIQTPEIAPRVEAFEARLLERMLEVDPQAGSLIERARELDARLAEFFSDQP